MVPVRFLHVSDVHLDTSLSGSGFPSRVGDRKREAIRHTFREILEEARSLPVDLVLLAGDLFEHDRVTPDTAEFLKQRLCALAPLPVFVSPGNHDPCVSGSPYLDDDWPPNVTIFREEEWRSVELNDTGLRVTGFGYGRSQLPARLFTSLPRLSPDLVNIVLAHASDNGRAPEGKVRHVPFGVDEIAGKNVQYCALGHYHQQRPVENAVDGTAIWYPGIPEPRGWDEDGEGGYLIGEVTPDGVTVETRRSGRYPLRSLAIACDGFTSREQIVDAVKQHSGSVFDERAILRVELTGYLDPRLDLSIPELDERLAGQALYVRWDDHTRPAIDFEAAAGERTLRGRFARTMNERIAAASKPEEREVLERARLHGFRALESS
jgi:DNA repair exonuclease SbcCD nuclease subunit